MGSCEPNRPIRTDRLYPLPDSDSKPMDRNGSSARNAAPTLLRFARYRQKAISPLSV